VYHKISHVPYSILSDIIVIRNIILFTAMAYLMQLFSVASEGVKEMEGQSEAESTQYIHWR
jgi:hypothetical protein